MRKEIKELKRLYSCARSDREMWQTAYLHSLGQAKDYFERGRYGACKEELKYASNMLELSANAREEMEQYKRELEKRKAVFDE